MEHSSAPLVEDNDHLIRPKRVKKSTGPSTGGPSKPPPKTTTPRDEQRLKALEKARRVRAENLKKRAREKKRQETAERDGIKMGDKPQVIEKVSHTPIEKQNVVAPSKDAAADQVAAADEIAARVEQDLMHTLPAESAVDNAQQPFQAGSIRLPPMFSAEPVMSGFDPTNDTQVYRGIQETRLREIIDRPTTSSSEYKVLPDVASPFCYTEDTIMQYAEMIADSKPLAEKIRESVQLELSKYESKIVQPGSHAYLYQQGAVAPSVNPAPPRETYVRELFSGKPSYTEPARFAGGFTAVPAELRGSRY